MWGREGGLRHPCPFQVIYYMSQQEGRVHVQGTSKKLPKPVFSARGRGHRNGNGDQSGEGKTMATGPAENYDLGLVVVLPVGRRVCSVQTVILSRQSNSSPSVRSSNCSAPPPTTTSWFGETLQFAKLETPRSSPWLTTMLWFRLPAALRVTSPGSWPLSVPAIFGVTSQWCNEQAQSASRNRQHTK